MMKKSEEKTIKYYNEHAQEWGEHHLELGEISRRIEELNKFHDLLPSGKIIEIGSGTGNDAREFLKLGYDYVGTDASIGLIKIAEQRNPDIFFQPVRVQDLAKAFHENEFDGFWAAAILLHIQKKALKNSLANIHSISKNGGIGFISVKQGEGEAEDDTGRFFAYYSQTEFAKILKTGGYEVIEKRVKPTEGKTVWLEFFVKVRK